MSNATINKLIEDFSELPLDDKEYAIEVMNKQITEAKREAILHRAKEAALDVKKGLVKKGTVRDLFRDLDSD